MTIEELFKKYKIEGDHHDSYTQIFSGMRNLTRMLVIGGCGMWTEFFPKAQIWTIGEESIHNVVGSATDAKTISMVPYGLDVVIDCRNNVRDQLTTLGLLWNHVRPGGYYFVENIAEPQRFAHLFPFGWHEQEGANMLVLLRGYGPDLELPGGWLEAASFNGLSCGLDVSAALQQVYLARRALSSNYEGVGEAVKADQMTEARTHAENAIRLLGGAS